MIARILRTLLGVLALMSLTTGLALAWPIEPPVKVILSGPGIQGEIEVTDPQSLDGLGPSQLMDLDTMLVTPPNVGAGYELHRYLKNEKGGLWDFDLVRYYPDLAGGRGYVFYVKAIGYGPSFFEGGWFRATAQGDAAMQRLTQQVAMTPSKAESPAARQQVILPVAGMTGPKWRPDGLIALGAVLVVGGGILGLRAKAAKR